MGYTQPYLYPIYVPSPPQTLVQIKVYIRMSKKHCLWEVFVSHKLIIQPAVVAELFRVCVKFK